MTHPCVTLVKVKALMSNYIPCKAMDEITYPCVNLILTMLVKAKVLIHSLGNTMTHRISKKPQDWILTLKSAAVLYMFYHWPLKIII